MATKTMIPVVLAGAAALCACSPATSTTTTTTTQTATASATTTQTATATHTATATPSAAASTSATGTTTPVPAGAGDAASACLANNLEAVASPNPAKEADGLQRVTISLRNKGPACTLSNEKTQIVFLSGPQNPAPIGAPAQKKGDASDPNQYPAQLALAGEQKAFAPLTIGKKALDVPGCQPQDVWALALVTEAGDYVVAPIEGVRTCANSSQIMMGGAGWRL